MSKSTYGYIRASGIRRLVKEDGKRCSSGFLSALDRYVYEKVMHCLKEHNGNRKTLDESLVNLIK